MLRTKVVVSLFALITVVSGANAPHWMVCGRRCRNNCKANPNPDKCATRFIKRRCKPFGERVFNVVKTNCLNAIACLNDGKQSCDDFKCILPEQCCRDAVCPANNRCLSNWCSPKGSPSFTLTWDGVGTSIVAVARDEDDVLNC
jgi:hypothetical protein